MHRSCFGTLFLGVKRSLSWMMVSSILLCGSFAPLAFSLPLKPVTAEDVKQEFLHSWNSYKKFAWGHDGLKPLSKSYFDWYPESLLMTPVDALDTILIMGLEKEAHEAKELIFSRLNFNKDMKVQHFEIAIRLLGGLVSSYQLDGDQRLLALAVDLADRMLPVFDSPTGMPYRFINLKTGVASGTQSNPAEIGSYLLEYGTLTKITGDQRYYEKAKRAMLALHSRRSSIGLVGTWIDVETGAWVDATSSIGACNDSYFEYMLKGWLLFGDQDLKTMWEENIASINTSLQDELPSGLWYGRADMTSGRRTQTTYGALDAFLPALLALGGDIDRGERLLESSYKMWKIHGIEPEVYDYKVKKVLDGSYPLRPEIIESTYYLFHFTADPKYQQMGYQLFDDIVRNCRTEAGYAALSDVRTMTKSDMMESFFLAETLKYFYLLFAENPRVNLNNVIFTTEAHPLLK